MEITKFISNQIEKQFPAIYREDGQELVDLVKEYYKFLESVDNQSLFNSRRMFEYRDIDSTLDKMLIFFKNKYLKDLPFNQDSVRFITKHILDLYRRKGSKEGIELFFRMFYEENVRIFYPATKMFKPSDSTWKLDRYIQMIPGLSPQVYTDLESKRIIGTISNAEAIVNRVVFILLNNTLTPIIYLEEVKGSFVSMDEILSGTKSYGRVYGSLTSLEVVPSEFSTSGNKIGDILRCSCRVGTGAKAIVTSVSENFSGEIEYTVAEGGFGYSVEYTDLIVSNQSLITANPTLRFNILEALEDQFGNRGIVIGQNTLSVGVKMEGTDEFTEDSIIQTVDRVPGSNFTVVFSNISERNDSSPGIAAQVDVLENQESISVIPDLIAPFLNVPLGVPDFYDYTTTSFSGSATVVNKDTQLSDAFNLEDITIGTIRNFRGVDPGTDYFNEVFALAIDSAISPLRIREQTLSLSPSATFITGDLIIQDIGTPNELRGKITAVSDSSITVRPYSAIRRFTQNSTVTYRGVVFNVNTASTNFGTNVYGFNSTINTRTEFAVGKITGLSIINSGYGYVDNSTIRLRKLDTNEIATLAKVSANGQGFNEGRWDTLTSNLGTVADRRIQDSFYYQDYSYDVLSKININSYEQQLKKVVHPAGVKLFGTFEYSDSIDNTIQARSTIVY